MLLSLWPAEDGKTAIISMGLEPGGDLVATVPYETDLHKIRAHMLVVAPEALDEITNLPNLAWFGPHRCQACNGIVPGAPQAQINRLEALIEKATPFVKR